MIELLQFQVAASVQIADRFAKYMEDPLTITQHKRVPFYQNLKSITGSGKTLILADAIEQIRVRLGLEPIVLWLSKGKVVVMQTFTNLSTGKYAHLVGNFDVKPLLDVRPLDVENDKRALLLVATVGKFNQKDMALGDRRIFRVGLDAADKSLWTLLKTRLDANGKRRPLLVVYDEGHNLSDQQTALLTDLVPDALLAASATSRALPEALAYTVDRLRKDKEWKDEDFVTVVPSPDVVAAGLVKKHVMLAGHLTSMESCVDELLREMKAADGAAKKLGMSFRPKAIYVSTTNIVEGVSSKEDALRPFRERLARPILIWRHLVETCNVDPRSIAVYCDLKFDKRGPPPADFNLFAGGDSDYERFMAGSYRHIIFNLSLQEGWDDPSCCFAYIDKDMGSPDQVTQLVGRVLRQPGAEHYSDSILNTAHFHIRTDEKGVFEAIIDDVRRKITSESPEITLAVKGLVSGRQRPSLEPRKDMFVPVPSIDSTEACAPIKQIIAQTLDFKPGDSNTIGTGSRVRVLQSIGSAKETTLEWTDVEHSNRVTARWIFKREIQKMRPKALHLCDIENKKFDVMIEYNSRAAKHLRDQAEAVVREYISRSVIVQNPLDHPYVVGAISVDGDVEKFRHALHSGYSGLNGLELEFARALDKTKRTWCRNPSGGGYAIELMDMGRTRQFRPDFLVWTEKDKYVVAIDTKADHLIVEEAPRKLFHIERIEPGQELVVRLVTKGEWHVSAGGQFEKGHGSAKFTVWRVKQGRPHPVHCANAAAAVQECLVVP